MSDAIRNDAPPSVIARTMLVLGAFAMDDGVLPLAELTRRTGLPKPTVRRLAGQLEDAGLLARSDQGYRPGVRLFELGTLFPPHFSSDLARPHLVELHRRLGLTVHFAVLADNDVLYLEKLAGPQGPRLPSRVGARASAHCTGLGKALVAHASEATMNSVLGSPLRRYTPRTSVMPGLLRRTFETVRMRGVAFDHEEAVRGVSCAAAPVLDESGTAVGAVSTSDWATRFDATRVADAVQRTAAAISAEVQAHHHVPVAGTAAAGH